MLSATEKKNGLAKCIIYIKVILIKIQLRWAGHISRMSDSELLKQLFDQLLAKRSIGRPVLLFKTKTQRQSEVLQSEGFGAGPVSHLYKDLIEADKHRDQLSSNITEIWHQVVPRNDNRTCHCGFVPRTKAGLAVH